MKFLFSGTFRMDHWLSEEKFKEKGKQSLISYTNTKETNMVTIIFDSHMCVCLVTDAQRVTC
jgi:hypothetical protein